MFLALIEAIMVLNFVGLGVAALIAARVGHRE